MKLVFLSDLHAGPSLGALNQKVWHWVLHTLSSEQPDMVILGGDLWQTWINAGTGGWVELLLQRLPEARVFSVPGNRDPHGFRLPEPFADRIQQVDDALTVRLPDAHLLLVNSNQPGRTLAEIQKLISEETQAGPLLVVAHHPLEEAAFANLPEHRASGLIVAGHLHQHAEWTRGSWSQCVTTGLDPLKCIGGLPEIVVVENIGNSLLTRTLAAPPEVLWTAAPREVVLGIAPFARLGELADLAIKHGIPAVQAVSHRQTPLPSADELARLAAWRAAQPGAFLSYHLPDPDLAASSGPLGGLDGHLAWCQQAAVNDYTIHLPNLPAERVYAAPDRFAETAEVARIQEIYRNLAQAVLDAGAFLSIENHHNDAAHFQGGRSDRLSSRPEHILQMIDWLRAELRRRGRAADEVERIGWIFDSGHARNNGAVTQELSLADWMVAGGGVFQTAHIHQVHLDPVELLKNHFVIRGIHEPLINHEGLLATFAQTPGPMVRAFVEVRDPEEAVTSWKLLSELLATRLASAPAPSEERVP